MAQQGGRARSQRQGKPVAQRARPEKRGGKQGGQAGPRDDVVAEFEPTADVVSGLGRKSETRLSAREILLSITQDEQASAHARASAARSLAEIDGSIGRHAPPPVRDAADIASLSRGDLVHELERLRAVVKAGPEA